MWLYNKRKNKIWYAQLLCLSTLGSDKHETKVYFMQGQTTKTDKQNFDYKKYKA